MRVKTHAVVLYSSRIRIATLASVYDTLLPCHYLVDVVEVKLW